MGPGLKLCQYEGRNAGMRSEHAKELYASCLKAIRRNMAQFLESMGEGEPIFAPGKTRKKTGDVPPAKKIQISDNIRIISESVTIAPFADADFKVYLNCNNPECEFWKAGGNSNAPSRCILEEPMDLPKDVLNEAEKAGDRRKARIMNDD